MATGRSDFPNQVNNVLGFPFIFRGALDVRASAINDEMKLAAAYALANLTKEDVPDSVLRAYSVNSLKLSVDYIIPKPLDPRVMLWVSPAVAQAAMDTGVARQQIDIEEYREQLAFRQGQGQQVRYYIMHQAQTAKPNKLIAFGEGEEPKIIRAAYQVEHDDIADTILIGDPKVISDQIKNLGLDFSPEIVDPNNISREDEYAQHYFELRQRKGVTRNRANKLLADPQILGPMLVKMGDADAFVSGLVHDYPEVIRPALQVHHTHPDSDLVAGVYIMIINKKTYIFTDATVNIEPSAENLAEIACLAANFAVRLGLEPRVAMLSFSNFGSTSHSLSRKVSKAVEILKKNVPTLIVDGEMQADTAVVSDIVDERYPFSMVKDANVLIFPSLEAANVSYKLLERLGGATTLGPILLGTGAPIHVLQRGADVRDIVNMAAIAVMDSIERFSRGCFCDDV
jgi:malate dehydrogenase (oxaloacetate-decarboxylating)(NADP+)